MDLYEAIFVRKSTRRFQSTAVDGGVLTGIGRYYEEVPRLVPGIATEIGIMDNTDGKHAPKGLLGVKAPYYLIIYSEKKDRYMMNAGFIMEYLSLHLLTRGLGSCILGSVSVPKAIQDRGNKTFVMAMAFGFPRDSATRPQLQARRIPMDKLCLFREDPGRQGRCLLEAARLAPSSMNRQPWRFVAKKKAIHVFSTRKDLGNSDKMIEFDLGCMFAHVTIAAEELWLGIDTIRLENISQNHFKSTDYVMSVLLED